jgi:hypothetical protein
MMKTAHGMWSDKRLIMVTAVRHFLGLTLIGSVCALVVSVQTAPPRADRAPLRFDPGALVIPKVLGSGREYDFEAVIVNESSEKARVIGSLNYCSGNCVTGRGVPADIPARGRGRVVVHLEAHSPENFVQELTFYTDQPSQPTITIKVMGTVGEDEASNATAHAATR